LTRDRILELLRELNGELGAAGTRGDVFVVGGAAMVLAYRARPATRDVDAIWQPSAEVRAAALRVAARHQDLASDWLTVSVASPEYLLATKILASRVSRDENDIVRLYGLCGLTTAEEGLVLLERYYPGRPVEAKVQFFLEELLGP